MTPTQTPTRFVTPAFPPADTRAAFIAIEDLGAEISRIEHTLGLVKTGELSVANPQWRHQTLRALEHLRRERTQFKRWLRDARAPALVAGTTEQTLIRALYDLARQQMVELRRFGQEPDEAAQTVLDNAHAYLSGRD